MSAGAALTFGGSAVLRVLRGVLKSLASRRRRGPVALRPRLSPGVLLSRCGRAEIRRGTEVVKGGGLSANPRRGLATPRPTLAISPRERLDDVVKRISGLAFGGTDCALPMLEALKHQWPVDLFVIYTDSETGPGRFTRPRRSARIGSGPVLRPSWSWSGWRRTGSLLPTRAMPACWTWSGSTRPRRR
jgi:hypothetical protein